MTSHIVQKGENLSQIAKQYQLNDWRLIYNHPSNAAFRERRPNPNLILPGDKLFIPPRENKTVTVRTGQMHRFVVQGPVPLPDLSWIKVRALYDDPWQTPLPDRAIDLTIDTTPYETHQPLQSGTGSNTRSPSKEAAENSINEPGTLLLTDVPNGAAEITFSREPGIESEISSLREGIDARLNGAYLDLLGQMSEFQKQWDDYGVASIAYSGAEGLYSGAVDWFGDQGDLFKAETWQELGDTIASTAGDVWDFSATYMEARYNDLKQQVSDANEWVEEATDNFFNWDWWSSQTEQAADAAQASAVRFVSEIQEDLEHASELLQSSAQTTEKIYRHRQAIIDLPKHLAAGDIDKVEHFVDTVLMDIDPAMATEIKNNPEWSAVLEVIADHDSILTYLAYVSLMLEAVPPNFYAYAGGKGGAYVLMEILLLVVCSLLSAGAATVGRLTMLAARFSSLAGKAGRATQKLKKGVSAIQSFARMLEDFAAAAQDLQSLGQKLRKGRNSGMKFKGRTGQTLEAKKKQEKRNKKCRLCGKENRKTPRHMRGTVEYK